MFIKAKKNDNIRATTKEKDRYFNLTILVTLRRMEQKSFHVDLTMLVLKKFSSQ